MDIQVLHVTIALMFVIVCAIIGHIVVTDR